jgi:AcrR family transcriptional regulator
MAGMAMAARSPKRPRGRPRKELVAAAGSTRDLLLEAAEEAFVELGYDGVTVQEIVSRAGFTTGAMYNHFAGKADLLIEVVRRALDRVGAMTRQAAEAESSLAATHAASVKAWFDIPAADRLMLAEVHLAASRHHDVAVLLDAAIGDAMQATEEAIVAAQRAGEVDPALDPAVLARVQVVFFAGMNHIDTIDPDIARDEGAKAVFAEWAAKAFAPAPPGRRPSRRSRG